MRFGNVCLICPFVPLFQGINCPIVTAVNVNHSRQLMRFESSRYPAHCSRALLSAVQPTCYLCLSFFIRLVGGLSILRPVSVNLLSLWPHRFAAPSWFAFSAVLSNGWSKCFDQPWHQQGCTLQARNVQPDRVRMEMFTFTKRGYLKSGESRKSKLGFLHTLLQSVIKHHSSERACYQNASVFVPCARYLEATAAKRWGRQGRSCGSKNTRGAETLPRLVNNHYTLRLKVCTLCF